MAPKRWSALSHVLPPMNFGSSGATVKGTSRTNCAYPRRLGRLQEQPTVRGATARIRSGIEAYVEPTRDPIWVSGHHSLQIDKNLPSHRPRP